jgi:hypothetical protein
MAAVPYPYKILQMPGEVILFEAFATFRQIFSDGRGLPVDPNPSWMGWIDTGGHPHSDEMHVTERYRRRDFGHIATRTTKIFSTWLVNRRPN